MRIPLTTALVSIFTVSLITFAQQPAPVQRESAEAKKERVAYASELEKLKRENPVKYEEYKKTMTLGLQMFLGEAGYGIGPFDGRTPRRKMRSDNTRRTVDYPSTETCLIWTWWTN